MLIVKRKTTRKLAIAFSIVVALLAVQVGVAFAHARLKSSTILPDSTITTVPATLSLTFTEETSPDQTKLQVLDASGKAVDKGDLKVSGDTATVSLGALDDGKYTVKFRSFTEDDSGIIDGEFNFTVAKSGTASNGNLASAKQEESNVPNAPAAGAGGGVDTGNSSFLIVVPFLATLGLLAGAGLVVVNRRNRKA